MLKELALATDLSEEMLSTLQEKISLININESLDELGNTALHITAKKGNVELVNFLLRNHAEIDKLNNSQQSPLNIATAFQHEAIVEILLKNGARSDLYNAYGFAPIHTAAGKPSTKILNLFLENATLVDFPTLRTKATPLMIAISKELEDNTWALLRAGAKVNAKNVKELPCIKIAEETDNKTLFEMLLYYGCEIPTGAKTQWLEQSLTKYRRLRAETSPIKFCVLSEKAKGTFPSLKKLAAVTIATSYLNSETHLKKLPAELGLFIKNFYKGLSVDPFVFFKQKVLKEKDMDLSPHPPANKT